MVVSRYPVFFFFNFSSQVFEFTYYILQFICHYLLALLFLLEGKCFFFYKQFYLIYSFYYNFSPWKVFHSSVGVSQESKSLLFSNTLLSILANVSIAEIFMVSILHLICNSSSSFEAFGDRSKRTSYN